MGRGIVEAETAEAACAKIGRKGYTVLEVSHDDSEQRVSFLMVPKNHGHGENPSVGISSLSQ